MINSDTMRYQKKYNFELNQRKSHETWNCEADVFKHAYGSALMTLDRDELFSTLAGWQHEKVTPNNPNKKSYAGGNENSPCVGSYPVSGYTRADGVEVKGYTRTCGAKHAENGKENIMEKYKNRKAQDMSKDEIDEFLSAYFS